MLLEILLIQLWPNKYHFSPAKTVRLGVRLPEPRGAAGAAPPTPLPTVGSAGGAHRRDPNGKSERVSLPLRGETDDQRRGVLAFTPASSVLGRLP